MAEREVNMGTTLYDMNKSIIEQTDKPMSRTALHDALNNKVLNYFLNKDNTTYFMLLCHERRDYTIFRIDFRGTYNKLLDELRECLKNRGAIYSIDYADDSKVAIEIWIKTDDDNSLHAYYLFPYDEGVIEIK